jgi:hypothetical protein
VDAVVLPRMCLPRCYLASYIPTKHDVQSFDENGLELDTNNVGTVYLYNINKRVDNIRVVQQAACQAIAKVAVKVSLQHPEQLQPLLRSHLITSFVNWNQWRSSPVHY